jgi:hypothetical protein
MNNSYSNFIPIALISLQQQYSLLERNSENEAFEVCKHEGVAILPWSPLKGAKKRKIFQQPPFFLTRVVGGLLSGKFSRKSELSADPNSRVAWAEKIGWDQTNFSRWNNDFTWNVLDKVPARTF